MAVLYAEEFREISEPLQGVREWLAALSRCNIPCAVVSSMDRCARPMVGGACNGTWGCLESYPYIWTGSQGRRTMRFTSTIKVLAIAHANVLQNLSVG